MKTNCSGITVVLITLLFATASDAQQADPLSRLATREQRLMTLEPDYDTKTFTVSPDSKRIAYKARRGDKWVVLTDGSKGTEYDAIEELKFSPDSARLAYAARRDSKWFAVLDGKEGSPHLKVFTLLFSPDSKRFAYQRHSSDKNSLRALVIDGVERGKHPLEFSLVFSPDSKRSAFVAGRERITVVVDGIESKEWQQFGEGSLVFSPDSKRVAYGVSEAGKWYYVVDGVAGAAYDAVGSALSFSPDSKRTAFGAVLGDKEFVVVDGKEGPAWNGIPVAPVFSPDGKRIAYGAQHLGKWFVVLDGVEQKRYDGLGSIVFSPDSKRVSYVAISDGKRIVVVDERESKPYDGTLQPGPVFSPDSKRVAFGAMRNRKMFMVVDGKEGAPYDRLMSVAVFSPDGTHSAYGAERNSAWFPVVDGLEGEAYGSFVRGSKLTFQESNVVRGLVSRDGDVFRIHATLVSASEGLARVAEASQLSTLSEKRFQIPFTPSKDDVDAVGSVTYKRIPDGADGVFSAVPERPGDAVMMSFGNPLGQFTGAPSFRAFAGEGSEMRLSGTCSTPQGGFIAEEGSRLCFRMSDRAWVYVCGAGGWFVGNNTNRLGHMRTVNSCLNLLQSKDPLLQEGAARDLGRLTKASDIPLVLPKLSSVLSAPASPASPANMFVRRGAIEALGLIGSPGCYTLLKQMLTNETDRVTKEYVQEALALCGGYALMFDPIASGVPLEDAASFYLQKTEKMDWTNEMLLVRTKTREAEANRSITKNAGSSTTVIAEAAKKLETAMKKFAAKNGAL